jgi:hypothetical protein
MVNGKLTIVISPTGETDFKVNGIKGASCEDITKPFIKAAGGELLENKRTLEFYEQPEEVKVRVNIDD